MKRKQTLKTLIAVVTLVSSSFVLHAQKSFDSALEYMDFIGEHYKQLTDDQWSYTRSVANDKSAKKIEAKRTELLQTNKTAQSKISKMPDFKGNTEYRDSIVSFLRMNYNVLNDDYDKIVNMEEIAEQSYDLMEAYLLAQEMASQKIREASDMLAKVEEKFAEDNNINLIENQSKKSKKLEQAGIMYKYYNKVYLIFFKCYKQESYLMDAISKSDVNAMEQSKNALLEYAEEGIKTLSSIQPFEGDNSIKTACTDILNFYKQEASKDTDVVIDFYLKKEKFESIQKAFEAKKKNDKTQEDVDNYNNAVNDYNNATNAYNATTEMLNKTRSKQIENWNSTSSKFTKKHV